MSETVLDISGWAKRNVWRTATGELCVRPGMRRVYVASDDITATRVVGGFSVRNDFVDEVWTYLAVQDVATRLVTLLVLDEDFVTFQSFVWGTAANVRAVTHAVVEGQMLICSPDLPTLAGMVGTSVDYAVAVASDNPSTTAIPVPRGIVTAFCNRFVIADGRALFFSDPLGSDGGDGRTFVGENQNQRPGIVYGLHEGAGGMLVCVTTAGTYGLDADAAAVQIVGSNGTAWRLLSHTSAQSHASSCVHRGRVYTLTVDGWAPCDVETDEETMLSDPMQPRARGPRIELEDFRTCRMLATDDGPLVASNELGAFARGDLQRGVVSWWTFAHADVTGLNPGDIVGVARDHDGSEMLIHASGIYRAVGDVDGPIALADFADAAMPIGTFAGLFKASAADNMLPRHIDIAAAVDGARTMMAAVRGSEHSATVDTDPMALADARDEWGDLRFLTVPIANAQIDFGDVSDSAATRDVGIEISAQGGGVRFNPAPVLHLSESAKKRPQAKG